MAAEEEIKFLRGVEDQATAARDRLMPERKPGPEDYVSNPIWNRPTPFSDARDRLSEVALGARLIAAALSERGLQLPNGEVFKISLESPSFLSATAREEQAWMGGRLSFPPVEQEGSR